MLQASEFALATKQASGSGPSKRRIKNNNLPSMLFNREVSIYFLLWFIKVRSDKGEALRYYLLYCITSYPNDSFVFILFFLNQI